MNPNCYGCRYRKMLSGLNITACTYAMETGKLRGDPPEKCKVKKYKQRGKN